MLYVWETRERHIRILLEKFKGRDHLGDLEAEGKIILKCIIKK
jgi:hypothetical protein